VALVGGSGKDSNRTALGGVRTYARLEPGQDFTPGAWVEAVRAGRTFVTNGPLLALTVDGEGPGAVLQTPGGRAVRVRAEARSAVPFDQVEVLAGGRVIAAGPASGDRRAATVEAELPVTAGGWVAARCRGRDRLAGGDDGLCVWAHTAPAYLRPEGRAPRPDAAAVGPLLAVLGQTLDWVARAARCPDERQRERLAGVLRAARDELLRRQGA
jgi:hypothetical protein